MEKIDFKVVVNYIFEKKDFYYKLTDEDKENTFFMVNRKFAVEYPHIAKLFNNKYTDRKSACDLWFLYFKNKVNYTPGWYWAKSANKDKNNDKKLNDSDKKLLMVELELDENSVEFLFKNYKNDVNAEIKKLKKYQELKNN
jgi:hypothetical protein